MSRSIHDDPERVGSRRAEPIEAQNLSSFLEQYRPMLRLLSDPDLVWLSREKCTSVRRFRRERAAIYFQYLGDLSRDLRALPIWTVPRDAEAFIKMDKASWMMQKLLVKLALEGVLYYIGTGRHDRGTARCFEKLGNLLNAVA